MIYDTTTGSSDVDLFNLLVRVFNPIVRTFFTSGQLIIFLEFVLKKVLTIGLKNYKLKTDKKCSY